MMVLTVDDAVVENWKVEEIQPRNLQLSHADGRTLQLEFNRNRKLEVKIEPDL